MDVLPELKDVEKEIPLSPEDFASRGIEKMLEALEKLELSDADKESLKKTLLSDNQMGDNIMESLLKPGFEILPGSNPLMTIVLILAFVVILPMFVFFGYKLYRSLTEKERKRDEKRKQKQLKKKK